MFDKAVDNYSITFEFVPDRYKSKKMCDKFISENPFMLKYCPDKYITRKKCDEAVDDFLPKLNFVPDWFVTSRMIKNLFTALYADEIHSILMKILVMLYLIVMKWVFLI